MADRRDRMDRTERRRAIEHAEKAMRLDPAAEDFYAYAAGDALVEMGRYQEAYQIFRDAKLSEALVPENSITLRPLAALMDWNPRDCSHVVIFCRSSSETPNCSPNCWGVSHL